MLSLTTKKNAFGYKCIIYLFLLTFEHNYSNISGVQFTIEKVFGVDTSRRAFPGFASHPLCQLSHEQNHTLCDAVMEHAPGVTSLNLPDQTNSPQAYFFVYPNYSGVHAIGIRCQTYPYTYVRLGRGKEEIKIVLVDRVLMIKALFDNGKEGELYERRDVIDEWILRPKLSEAISSAAGPPERFSVQYITESHWFIFMDECSPDGVPIKFKYKSEVVEFISLYGDGSMLTYEYTHLHPFVRLDKQKLKKICKIVKKKASLDGMSSEVSDDMLIVGNYEIFRYKEDQINAIVLNCPTIPNTFLRLGNSKEDIIVMTKRNKYKHYKFIVDRVKSHQVHGPIPSGKVTGEYNFSRYADSEMRQFMCLAAKGKIERKTDDFKIVLQRLTLDDAQLVEIEIEERKEQHVVVSCSSLPVMYVYFDESEPSKIIRIILIVDE